MAEPKIGKQRPKRNVGLLARKATRRESARKIVPIWRKPDLDLDGPNKEIGSGRTTPKDRKDLKK